MKHILRTPYCQRQAFIEPLAAWLRLRGVQFLTGAFVKDIGFAPTPDRITVDRLDYRTRRGCDLDRGRAGGYRAGHHRLAGRRLYDGDDGHAAEAAERRKVCRSVAAPGAGRTDFGNPDVYFDPARPPTRAG